MDKKLPLRRARNPDYSKIAAILNLLKEYPDGIWVREIGKQVNISASMASRYLDERIADFVDTRGLKNADGKYLGPKFITLKPAFRNREFTADSVRKLLETQKFLKSIGK